MQHPLPDDRSHRRVTYPSYYPSSADELVHSASTSSSGTGPPTGPSTSSYPIIDPSLAYQPGPPLSSHTHHSLQSHSRSMNNHPDHLPDSNWRNTYNLSQPSNITSEYKQHNSNNISQSRTSLPPSISTSSSAPRPLVSATSSSPNGGARPPRSRKNRPCDLCRRSKSRCTIGAGGPPCTQCSETNKACTFDFDPPPRKTRVIAPASIPLSRQQQQHHLRHHQNSQHLSQPKVYTSNARGIEETEEDGADHSGLEEHDMIDSLDHLGGGEGDEDLIPPLPSKRRKRDRDEDDFIRKSNNKVATDHNSHNNYTRSLEEAPNTEDPNEISSRATSVAPGPAAISTNVKGRMITRRSSSSKINANISSFDQFADSDFDPHVLTVVLTDDLLPISDPAAADASASDGPHVKQISSDPARPIFVVMHPKNESAAPLPSMGVTALTHIRVFLRHHPLHPSEPSLLSIYNTQIHPALPILPNTSHPNSTPPQLLAAIICSSLSHQANYRPLAPPAVSLYGTASLGQAENSLAGVAAAVLELGMRPSTSSRSSYLLLAKTIALAQLLGMHMNPLKWAIPKWEQELRVRLWWTLAIHDAWMSFLNSRPCHIQAYNSTVPVPLLSSVVSASSAFGPVSIDSAKSFIASCRLAQLVCRLQAEVCTLGVVNDRSASERRDEVGEIAVLVDEMYIEWKDLAVRFESRATGVNSFLVHLLGFRCMLKRIQIELEHGLGSTFTPSSDVLGPFHECVDFVSRLSDSELDGYFLIYAPHILSSVTSSLIRLTLASDLSPAEDPLRLLSTLITSLRSFHTNLSWDIATPALRRAAAVAARFRGLDEHIELCEALQGSQNSSSKARDGDGGTVHKGNVDTEAVNQKLSIQSSNSQSTSGVGVGTTTITGSGLVLPSSTTPNGTSGGEQQFMWDFSATEWDFNSIFNFAV